jgi:outer membrane receptor for ferrienterochelin and colicins
MLGKFQYFGLILCLGFRVSAQTDTLWTDVIEPVVITAQYAPTELQESVNTIKVINRDVILSRGVSNLLELLQAEANVRVSYDAILGSSISINGIQGENIKILLDGVPITGRINGNIDVNQIPLTDIQRIEIVEGSQSMIYGSDASGGVINLITKKSQLATLGLNAQTLYESNGTKSVSTMVGIQKNKFYANISGQLLQFSPSPDSVGQREQYWNPKDQYSLRSTLRYHINPQSELRASGGILSEKIYNLGAIKRPQYKPYAVDNIYFLDRGDANLFYQKSIPNQCFMQGSFRYSYYDRIDNVYRFDKETSTRTLLELGQDTNKYVSYNNRLTYASDQKNKLNYLLGFELSGERAIGNRLLDSANIDSKIVDNREWGLFASLRYKPTKMITLQGENRWVYNEKFGSTFVPSIWIALKLNSSLILRSSVARGYRSPSLEQLYFYFVDINHNIVGKSDLLPERSITSKVEFSYAISLPKNLTANVQFSSFYNHIKDRIIFAEIDVLKYQYRNIDIWRTTGINCSWNLNYKDRIKLNTSILRAGYYNELSFEDNSLPQLSWATDWSNDLTVFFGVNQKLFINIWQKQTGKTPYFYIDKNGETKQDLAKSWLFANANIGTKLLGNTLTVQLGVKNITNIKKLNSATDSANHSGTGNQQTIHWGRTLFASATYSL